MRTSLKRAGTLEHLMQVAAVFGFSLNLGLDGLAEIDAFNCSQYPNRVYNCPINALWLTCVVNLPPCR
jgi:hypothetical protein